MADRKLDRIKRQLPCEIRDGREPHDGLITDFSSDGLFVETSAKIPTGLQLALRIHASDAGPEITLRAIVIRQRLVRSPSCQLITQGLGLRILEAPDTYYTLAAGKTPTGADLPKLKRFRVQVRDEAGSSHRTMLVTSASAHVASEQLLAKLGPGWEITDVEEYTPNKL